MPSKPSAHTVHLPIFPRKQACSVEPYTLEKESCIPDYLFCATRLLLDISFDDHLSNLVWEMKDNKSAEMSVLIKATKSFSKKHFNIEFLSHPND